MDNKYYDVNNDIWGDPQIYKGVEFYPLRVYQRKEYEDFYTLFTLNQEQIPDKNIAKMSYLKFLICIVPQIRGLDIVSILINFLKVITKQNNITILDNQSEEDKNAIINLLNTLSGQDASNNYYIFFTQSQLAKLRLFVQIGNEKFSEQDFETIREIILKQQGLDLDYIRAYDPTLEDNLRVLHKGNDATFEEQVFSLSAAMRLSINEIKNTYTIYQFYKTIERLNIVEDYESFKGLESAGFIKLKKGEISHWLSHVPKLGRYDGLLVKKETFIKDNEIFKVSKNR